MADSLEKTRKISEINLDIAHEGRSQNFHNSQLTTHNSQLTTHNSQLISSVRAHGLRPVRKCIKYYAVFPVCNRKSDFFAFGEQM